MASGLAVLAVKISLAVWVGFGLGGEEGEFQEQGQNIVRLNLF